MPWRVFASPLGPLAARPFAVLLIAVPVAVPAAIPVPFTLAPRSSLAAMPARAAILAMVIARVTPAMALPPFRSLRRGCAIRGTGTEQAEQARPETGAALAVRDGRRRGRGG